MTRTRTLATCAIVAAFIGLPLALMASGAPSGAGDQPDIIMSNGAEPVLDPSLMTDIPSMNVGLGLFEGLMQYDPETNLGVPAMAESWSVSPDGLVYTFRLRQASWSDGHPVTADDFVYAMERMLDPATAAEYAYMPCMVIKGAADFNAGEGSFDGVGIKAVDARTIQYTLTGPAPYFVDMTAHNAFWPLPRWAIEKFGDDWTKPGKIVTNGPFLLREWRPQEYVYLVRNPRYWDAAGVRLRSIMILAGDNDSTNYSMYKDGQVDWMHGVAFSRIDEIRSRPDFQCSAQIGTYFYCFNVTRPPADNVLVRRALSAAIDKKRLVETVTKGGQVPSDSFVPPLPGYKPQPGQGYDPEKARRMLAEAGYPGGAGFPRMTIYYNTNMGHKAIAEYIKAQWKENLGIDVSLKDMEFKTFIDLRSKSHNFAVCRHGWIGDYLDPCTMLDLFVSGGGNNDGLYSNPTYDALIEAAQRSTGAERMELFEEAEETLLGDAAVLPIYYYSNLDLIDTSVWGGWHPTTMGFHPWKYIYRIVRSPDA